MKITEIVNGISAYQAAVRVKRGKSSVTVKTIVFADGISQAKAMLSEIFDDSNVMSVSRISDAEINETSLVSPDQIINPRVFPNRYKRDLAQKLLLQQLKRNAMIIRPNADDLKAARSDFETEQKRVDREYVKWAEDKLKWAEIRKRRLASSEIF
jgi:hypothetical protein